MSDLFAGIRIPRRTALVRPRGDAHQRAVAAGRREPRVKSGDKTISRFLLRPLSGRGLHMPAFDAAFVVEGRTKYPHTRTAPSDGAVLKSGAHQAKIGGRILKGKWRGMPVYCLTLEERATCPADCPLWRGCYGNGMNWAHRFAHGPELERRLPLEVAALAALHPDGFVVRLHILGDFYSTDYVALWAELLRRHAALRIYGYTARWRRDDPIAAALIRLAMDNWDRFAMRFSNAPITTCSTLTVDHLAQVPADTTVCPVQLGQTESCSTCALCWQTDRRIAFIRH